MWIVACVCALVAGPVWAESDAIAKTARDLLAKYEKAIVHVEAVVKITAEGAPGMGGGQEQKVKVIGTMVDPSGLTVVSFLDPTATMGTMKVRGPNGPMEITLRGEVSDVKFRLADGTEVAAKTIMTDDDLGLVFVGPDEPLDKKTKAKIASIDLSNAADKAEAMDQIITLGRLGKSLNHVASVNIGRIRAIVPKPRTLYVGAGSLGSPVFTEDGKLLGICTRRGGRGAAQSVGASGSASASITPIILPAADVKEIADQALEEMKK